MLSTIIGNKGELLHYGGPAAADTFCASRGFRGAANHMEQVFAGYVWPAGTVTWDGKKRYRWDQATGYLYILCVGDGPFDPMVAYDERGNIGFNNVRCGRAPRRAHAHARMAPGLRCQLQLLPHPPAAMACTDPERRPVHRCHCRRPVHRCRCYRRCRAMAGLLPPFVQTGTGNIGNHNSGKGNVGNRNVGDDNTGDDQ